MQKHPIATIINFCSNESQFIKATLEQALTFSSQVIVPVCDHFFDGLPEDKSLLEKIYSAFPECLFVEYPFLPEKVSKNIFKKVGSAHFWHSFSRVIGLAHVNEEIETILFLDADEVPDGKKFALWLDSSDYRQHTVLKLSNYWYFREPVHQALTFEDSIVLAHKSAIDTDLLLQKDERDAIYNLLPGPKRRQVLGIDGKPMFHHYSWVRSKEKMLQKVRSWGHKEDRDWVSLVEKEFQMPFQGTDFVHGYKYKNVLSQFGVSLEIPEFTHKATPQMKRLRKDQVLRYMKQKKFWELFGF